MVARKSRAVSFLVARVWMMTSHHESLTDSKARGLLDQSFIIYSELATIRRIYKAHLTAIAIAMAIFYTPVVTV